jgi:hypothetical protein
MKLLTEIKIWFYEHKITANFLFLFLLNPNHLHEIVFVDKSLNNEE